MPSQKRQSQLNIITGMDWIAYETVKSIVYEAVNLAEYLKDMTTWHPWNNEVSQVEDNSNCSARSLQKLRPW